MFSSMFLLFQSADTSGGGEKTSQSLFQAIAEGGALGIIIAVILLLLAVFAVYILVERYLTIRRAGEVDQDFMRKIQDYVKRGDIQAAFTLCAQADTPVSRLVAKGLQRIGKPLEDINTAIENVGNLEIFKLEKRLSMLATISGAAPMIGFFGTVTGMIMSFMEMANAKGGVEPAMLAGGIYQALLTTAFGLFVGIIAFVGYNYLISSVDRVVFKMEAATVEFMDVLQEPA